MQKAYVFHHRNEKSFHWDREFKKPEGEELKLDACTRAKLIG